MTNIQLDYSDISDIFKEKLKIDNIVKKISSVFLNQRYSSKIDYKPYFQRNYVWDTDKATYFIESIILGTEIPPLVLFQTHDKNEVIDGRQRYETIERFLNDRFSLTADGLHSLHLLAGKKYSQLSDKIREQFEETRIRILQFKVVNEPKLDAAKEDKIKKEIFRRYNSGITPLAKEEIERASYINDNITQYFYSEIFKNDELFSILCNLFLPVRKAKATKRDQVNYLVTRIRTLLSLPYIPIYFYAHGSSKLDIIKKAYGINIANNAPEDEYSHFKKHIYTIREIKIILKQRKSPLHRNRLLFEVLYWAFSILSHNNIIPTTCDYERIVDLLLDHPQDQSLWHGVINIEQYDNYDNEILFESTGSHYYSSIVSRYYYISNLFNRIFEIDFADYLRTSGQFKADLDSNFETEFDHYHLNKPLPETLTIEDIISDMKRDRFMIRPEYQRSEVKNIQKASYLMESILLGINIPPIFIYKREDKVKEVVDGQQRLLSILGFLGKTYKDEHGINVNSNKDKFKLTKLRILTDLNGENIDTIPQIFQDSILEFPMDVIEIDSSNNPEFSQTDLFTRLNSKPYPIRENTFEMWNAYVDKTIILKIKEVAQKYQSVVFKASDTRMKLEELIASLAYIDYKSSKDNTKINQVLSIYRRNDKICARITGKEHVTKTLTDLSNTNPEPFFKSIQSVELFAKKIEVLLSDDPLNIRKLFSHSKSGIQCKTDQNYYFLWIMLSQISVDDIKKNKAEIFSEISALFSKIQRAPLNYSADDFLSEAYIHL